MKKWLACWLVIVAMTVPALGMAAEFSQNTQYREEVLSVAPYRIKYVLTGQTRIQPSDFEALRLDGQATFVYALADKHVFVYSDGLYIGSPSLYLWPYEPFVNIDPTNPVNSITATIGTGFAQVFSRTDAQDYRLTSEFIVELKPGFTYQPNQVRMQVVYLAEQSAPYIDVFRRQF
ncbi:hypothetical protein [Pinirhizobacter soli]|uniref:hypothetical protein n=1 Tax=Pinirhizobacter soli TaxID=2786953 RepID=UPI00202A652C|nr:hypothetical protein [Pinirhizobacter soli]